MAHPDYRTQFGLPAHIVRRVSAELSEPGLGQRAQKKMLR